MALRRLHLLGSPVLRQESEEVVEIDEALREFVDDLFETMEAAQGIGLAANQVGVAQRVAVVGIDDDRLVMINPRVVESSGKDTAEEGCLSIPEIFADVTRPERIVLEALDREGSPYRLEAEGLKARAIQHEIDHLDGILFLDRLSPLKRRMLQKRWQKSGLDTTDHTKEVAPAPSTT